MSEAMRPARVKTFDGPSSATGKRLRQDRLLRASTGRQEELERFRAALERHTGSPVVLALHGPGGIGKTALLQRFAVEARQRGRRVVEVDAEQIDPTEEAFAAAMDVAGAQRVVLLVDAVDCFNRPERWLRDRLIAEMPADSLAVLASRCPPSLSWRTDPAWDDTLEIIPLHPLHPTESAHLLHITVPGQIADRRSRLAFAGGHPLALRAVGRDPGITTAGGWQPSPYVVEGLLDRVVGAVPSLVHRRALEICAHLTEITEDSLRLFLPDHAHEVFDWMRRQPYIESRRSGLSLLSVVGEALDRDLRWRAPGYYLTMHQEVRAHVTHLVRSGPEPDSLRAAALFNHVQAMGRWLPGFDWTDREEHTYEGTCGAEDISAALDLAREVLDTDGVKAFDFWLHRRPASFRLYRSTRTGKIAGCLGLLNFNRWDAVETAVDPVVAQIRNHVETHRELRSGQQVQLVRFALVRRHPLERPAVLARMMARITQDILSQDQLEWTFACNSDGPTARLLEYADFHRLPRTPWLMGQGITLWEHDWGLRGVDEWIGILDNQMISGPPSGSSVRYPRPTHLSRAVFDRAVHDALRNWHRWERIADNPLLQAAFVAALTGNPEENLRTLIVQAIEAADEGGRTKQQQAVVRATYLEGTSTQQAVARKMSLSFSTYRRYLKQGIERVCWQLWKHETTRTALAASSFRALGSPGSDRPPPPAAS
ncbi:AAA family ATPase [Streptomyces chartreusis]